MVVLGQELLYSGKVVVFGRSGCIRVKWLCFCKKLSYSGKSGCNRDKVAVFGQGVVFGQSGCIRAKVVVFRQTLVYSRKVVVIGQKLF